MTSEATLRLVHVPDLTDTGSRRHLVLLSTLLCLYAVVALFGPRAASDEGSYLTYADNLIHGFYSGRGEQVDLWFGPGLPLLVAPLAALGAPLDVIRLLGPLLLFAAVVLFYVVLRMTTSSSAALWGVLALGLYIPLLTLLPTLHSEIPALFWVVSFMFFSTVRFRRLPVLSYVLPAASWRRSP